MATKSQRLGAEDLWRIARPAQPTLSPDGAQVCVSVTTYDMEENKGRSKLWLLSTFGGEPRALTEAGEKDGEPRWSPDGTNIAFVAKRDKDEEPQLWLIAPDGGEARRVTQMPTGVSGIKWFPDSRRVAFISWVWPDAVGYQAHEARYKEHKDSKVKAHVVEHEAYRYWDHWLSDGRVPRLFVVDVATQRITDLFSGTPYELPAADPSAHHYDIAPEGGEIAFTFDPAEEKRFDHEYHVVVLDLRGKRFSTVTKGSRLSHGSPSYSPDGRWLALLTRDIRRSPVAESRIALIERRTGRLKPLPDAWDRDVHGPLAWEADSSSLVFVSEDRARTHAFRWRLGESNPEIAALGGTVSEFAVAQNAIVFVRNAMSTPPAVFCTSPDRGERRIDRFNDDVMAGIALGEVREFEIRGWNGRKVQMWAIYPPNFDPSKKWPLLHNIHGGPHGIWGDNFHFRWNNHAFAAQGYVVVCVNYHGSSSFGQRFLESINGEWGKREYADVEAGTDFMLRTGYIDRRRLLAAGGSYGGYMVAWMNGHTDRYKAFVCHAGCFDWVAMFSDDAWYWHPKELGAFYWDDPGKVDRQNPRAQVQRMKTPTLVMHGLLDYRVPDSQALAYYNTLKARGVPARLVFFPDENHWILKPQNSRLWYREFFAWLERHAPARRKRRK
ncbi:MAG: S9 family peptidase [Betaproteobacteria bacterium]|nr:S9 family peptidase [Betaproteobacteria bacterium]